MSPEAARTKATLRAALPRPELAAVEAWLGTFYPFQLEWLLDPHRFALTVKSRQIGASHTYGGAATLWGLVGETTTVVSVGEREAIEVVDKSYRHAMALHALGCTWAEPVGKKATEVRFASGGRVIALPSTSAGRGYSGNVILDEFGYHEQAKKVWDGAGGTVMHGGKLRVLSTPNGTGNLWHQLWSDPKANAGYRRHLVTVDDAIAQGMRVSIDECWKMARGDARVFDQLFRCRFLDGDAQYIGSELLDDAFVDDTYCYDGECFAGLDIGRTVDRTVLVIDKLDADGVFWQQARWECRRTSQEDIDALVARAFGEFPLRRLCVDATGIGAFPAETLQKRFGKFRVEPVVFTQQSKEALATTMYQALAERRVRIPREDATMRDDLAAIRRIVTTAGNVRYDAPHTDAGHADAAWAKALAIYAGTGPGKRKHVVQPPPPTTIDPF